MTSDVALAHLASAVWPHGFASTVHAAVQGVVQGAQLSSRLQYLFFQAAAKFAGSLGVVQMHKPLLKAQE
ncbi:hypothetical protein HaLaN_04508 [Haematococcus lacustris]|uniref:Uncharacterized protein n=1 Tax=Haematococcus lacustris TaxID=44745 RepID=A0A699YRG8_HAELA|nr:hypothetical protein HaLaN_04508 [Haematococcus lacustris]